MNPALPDLTDEEGNPVNFRRALLNKCQEEFDYGVNAMKAVAERERREEEGMEENVSEEIQENQMTDEDRSRIEGKAEKLQLEKAAADAEVKARKRMLGNIIFVGQLYRFGVLIEAVMHSCIKQLLEEVRNCFCFIMCHYLPSYLLSRIEISMSTVCRPSILDQRTLNACASCWRPLGDQWMHRRERLSALTARQSRRLI